jgi:hypothetical protein
MLIWQVCVSLVQVALQPDESMSIRQKQFGKSGFVDSAKVAESTLQFGNAFKNHIRFGKMFFFKF